MNWRKLDKLVFALLCLLCLLCACGEKTTEDGLCYTKRDGAVAITGYEGEAPLMTVPARIGEDPVTLLAEGAVPAHVTALSLPEGLAAEEGAFAQAEKLKWVFAGGTEKPAGLPEECIFYYGGQDTGLGALTDIALDELGNLCGTTEEGTVVLAIPAATEYFVMPETACYLAAGALDGVQGLKSVSLGEDNGFAPEMLEELRELEDFFYPEPSVTADYVLTVEIIEQANQARAQAGMDPLRPDLALIRAAGLRTAELWEAFSYDRPDGRSGYTALEEAGAEYNLAKPLAYRNQSDMDAMVEQVSGILAESYADPEADILYERIGVSSGVQLEHAESPYVMAGFLTTVTQEQVTNDSVTYELRDGVLVPISSEDRVSLYLPAELNGRQTGAPAEEFFASVPSLRLLFLAEDYLHAQSIPDQYVVICQGEDSGDGAVTSVHVDAAWNVYALTDRNRYVFWCTLSDEEDISIRRQIDGVTVSSLRPGALEPAKSQEATLLLPDECGFAEEDLDIIDSYSMRTYNDAYELVKSDQDQMNTVYYSIMLTRHLVEEINEARSGDMVKVTAPYELARAARILVKEQPEQFGVTRPDGSSWTTALDEVQIEDWEKGRISLKKYTDLTEVQSYLSEMVEKLAPAQEEGHVFTKVAMALHVVDGAYYFCTLATLG